MGAVNSFRFFGNVAGEFQSSSLFSEFASKVLVDPGAGIAMLVSVRRSSGDACRTSVRFLRPCVDMRELLIRLVGCLAEILQQRLKFRTDLVSRWAGFSCNWRAVFFDHSARFGERVGKVALIPAGPGDRLTRAIVSFTSEARSFSCEAVPEAGIQVIELFIQSV